MVEAVLAPAPERLWSVDDLRERLAFGRSGAGPAASSVRTALRHLGETGRAERVDVWGRQGWGGTAHAWRRTVAHAQMGLPLAA